MVILANHHNALGKRKSIHARISSSQLVTFRYHPFIYVSVQLHEMEAECVYFLNYYLQRPIIRLHSIK